MPIKLIVLAKQDSRKARHFCKYNSFNHFVLKWTRLIISWWSLQGRLIKTHFNHTYFPSEIHHKYSCDNPPWRIATFPIIPNGLWETLSIALIILCNHFNQTYFPSEIHHKYSCDNPPWRIATFPIIPNGLWETLSIALIILGNHLNHTSYL